METKTDHTMGLAQFFYQARLAIRTIISARLSLLVVSVFFLQNLAAQTKQDSVATADSIPPARPAPITVDSSGKPLAPKKKHIAHLRQDSSTVVSPDSSHLKSKAPAIKAALAVQEQLDSIRPKIEMRHDAEDSFIFKTTLSASLYFNFLQRPTREAMEIHHAASYDGLFYLLLGILFYFALIRLLFGKYLVNLLTLFFRASMRQQQIREQVLQSPLPSLLLNILFVIVGGLYGVFLAQYYHFTTKQHFWLLFLDFSLLLCIIYLVKFLLLKSAGWVFNIQKATDTYIFIVFLTNKMLAVFLLPFLIMLSFSDSLLDQIAITCSLVIVAVFFAHRFIASFAPVRKEIKMNGFHFFLYLCAFEIAPLLLIYKLLLTYLEKAY